MFETFTDKAIKTIMLAQEEARRLGHNFVGTEQILLGLVGEGTGIAAAVLKLEGATLSKTRIEVEKIIGRGTDVVALEIPFTLRAKSILEKSYDASKYLKVDYIGTEHLLLGVIKENGGVALDVFNAMNIDLNKLRAITLLTIDKLNKHPALGASGAAAAVTQNDTIRAFNHCPNCYQEVAPQTVICKFCKSKLFDNTL